MASKTDYLDRLYVASPCKTNWDNMTGTDQVRHCAECNRDVYDLSKMTRRQAEHLIIINRGRLCARITRSPEGAVVTQEEPGLHLITRCASPVAAAVVSAVITVGSAAPALASLASQQTQVSVVANSKAQSSEDRAPFAPMTLGPFAPITLDPANPAILEVKIDRPALGGVVAIVRLTLRELYDKSDLVVIGRAAGSSATSQGHRQKIATHYQVASVLKGNSRRQQISVAHDEPIDESFAEGKTALLFLSKGNSENGGSRGGYVLADFSTGIKALPQVDIDTYAARIRDLDAIERREHNSADIIEWLVRCAEDPATRWEGAYELATDSADSFDPEQADSDKTACKTAKADAGGPPDQAKPEAMTIDPDSATSLAAQDQSGSDEEKDTPAENLASKLTETQRERLVTALLSTQTITEADLKLIEIIKAWKDPRLVDFLLARLHAMEDNPPEIANELVGNLSDIIGGEDVAALADQFSDLPAEEADPDNEGDRNDQVKGWGAPQSVKVREAAQKRSAALKEFLAVVERRRRAQPSTQT